MNGLCNENPFSSSGEIHYPVIQSPQWSLTERKPLEMSGVGGLLVRSWDGDLFPIISLLWVLKERTKTSKHEDKQK